MTVAPGPYLIQEIGSHSGTGSHVYIVDANGRKIANVWGKAEEKYDSAILLANAHVMLAALKQLVECLDLAEKNDDLPLPFAGYGRQFIDDARSAIARAEGAE